MDIVFIHGLEVETTIGAYDWEQGIKQTLILDLELACDTRIAAKNDNLEDALDYAAISQEIIDFLGKSHFQLLETLAEKVTDLILSTFNIEEVKLKVSKPKAVSHARDVGVIITRNRSQIQH